MDEWLPPEPNDLPEELLHLVKPELQPGERLLWASRACAILPSINPWPSRAACARFTGFAVICVCSLSMVTNKNLGSDGFFGVIGLLSGMIIFFFMIGFVNHFFSKQEERRKMTGQVYALTDRRAVIWVPSKRSADSVHTFQRGTIRDTYLWRVQNPDGSGDVLFGRAHQQPSGFLGIADVRRAEELVRRFLVVPGQLADRVEEALLD